MSTTPNFATTPSYGAADLSTANTNRDGTGTIATVLTAGSSGTIIQRIVVQAKSTTTAGQVRLFVHDGTTARLLKEVSVSALTPSATVQAFTDTLDELSDPGYLPLILESGQSLRASTHNAETFAVHAWGGDF